MSFKRYLLTETCLVLFVLVTLPLWLPVWCCIAARDWYKDIRYGWECMEACRKHDEARAMKERA
jgi:hypothetical protein